MIGMFLALFGAAFFALGGWNVDSWVENRHAVELITAFVDVAVGSYWIGLAIKYGD